jgi:hypothetical protein
MNHADNIKLLIARWSASSWLAQEEARKDAIKAIDAQQAKIDRLREALEGLMRWQVENVKTWHNSAYDNAALALEQK